MAKKKIKRKKVVKKKAKKTIKKKAKGKSKRKNSKKPPVIWLPQNFHLHTAKMKILTDVPIMPCSAISKDIHGLKYAYTQADKVYQVYREKCKENGLVIRRIEGKTTDGTRPDKYWDKDKERFIWAGVPCVRFEGVWEIEHIASGEKETFGGAGDGDNMTWACNSAQTVARKQALLDYFETAWPQPTDWVEVVRKTIEEMPPKERIQVIEMIIPKEIAKATGIYEQMGIYFDKVYRKTKGAKNGNRTTNKRKG